MKPLAFVLSLFAVLALAFTSEATDCRRVVRIQRVQQVHVQQVQHVANVVAVKPVIAAVFTPVAVAVPYYSVGYSQDNSQLLSEIRQLRFELEKLQQGPLPLKKEALKEPGEHPAVGILKKHCASCHDSAVSKGKGGGFSLFDGPHLAKLSDKQLLQVVREAHSGRMPKAAKPLSDEDIGQLMNWLDTIK